MNNKHASINTRRETRDGKQTPVFILQVAFAMGGLVKRVTPFYALEEGPVAGRCAGDEVLTGMTSLVQEGKRL